MSSYHRYMPKWEFLRKLRALSLFPVYTRFIGKQTEMPNLSPYLLNNERLFGHMKVVHHSKHMKWKFHVKAKLVVNRLFVRLFEREQCDGTVVIACGCWNNTACGMTRAMVLVIIPYYLIVGGIGISSLPLNRIEQFVHALPHQILVRSMNFEYTCLTRFKWCASFNQRQKPKAK